MQTAFVTGATSGIGRALVLQLVERGVTVFATGRDRDRLRELMDETGCLGEAFDLAEPESAEAAYVRARRALGVAPDFVINNAGFNSRKAELVQTNDEELELQWAVNLRAPLVIAREALRDMTARRSGHLVNVLSTVVKLGIERMSLYSAMKHGLHGATLSLIKEARPHGVKVTGVYPGGTDSGFRVEDRPDYLAPASVAHMICGVLFAPADVVVHELTFRPLVESNF
ncbi:MAG TPA: SDR family oxidoreductase [Polyangiaceae bacterium]|nr:SDR family oxidoreductase [Polyangiaceae bacterium]